MTCTEETRNNADLMRPAWGLTAAIPEGVTLSWGARAIYSWITVTKPIHTATGKIKISRGRKLTSTTREPVIDLVWDRQGFASDPRKDEAERLKAFCAWINEKGVPAIKAQCRGRLIQTSDDGPEARLEFSSDGYTIVANPNGSCGYLYIAAWKVVE